MSNIAIENGPFIMDLPLKMVIFSSYGTVYQRVYILWLKIKQKKYPLVMSNIAIENGHFGIVDESPLIAWWIVP